MINFDFKTIPADDVSLLMGSLEKQDGGPLTFLLDAAIADYEAGAPQVHELNVGNLPRLELSNLLARCTRLRDGFAKDKPDLAALFAHLAAELWDARYERDVQVAALERMERRDDFSFEEPDFEWTATVPD